MPERKRGDIELNDVNFPPLHVEVRSEAEQVFCHRT